MFKHSRLSNFKISQVYFWTPKTTKSANGKIFHNFKAKHFGDARSLFQYKTSVGMIIHWFKELNSVRMNNTSR